MSKKFFENIVPIGDTLKHKVVGFLTEPKPVMGNYKQYTSEILSNGRSIVQGYFEVSKDQAQLTDDIHTQPTLNLKSKVKSTNSGLNPIPNGHKLLVVKFDNPYLDALVNVDLYDLVEQGETVSQRIAIDTDRLQIWAGDTTDLESNENLYCPLNTKNSHFKKRKKDQLRRFLFNLNHFRNPMYHFGEYFNQDRMQRELRQLRQQSISKRN